MQDEESAITKAIEIVGETEMRHRHSKLTRHVTPPRIPPGNACADPTKPAVPASKQWGETQRKFEALTRENQR